MNSVTQRYRIEVTKRAEKTASVFENFKLVDINCVEINVRSVKTRNSQIQYQSMQCRDRVTKRLHKTNHYFAHVDRTAGS